MVSFADLLFKFPLLPPSCFLDPLVLAFGIVKLLQSSASKTASVTAEQRALLVFPARMRAFESSLWDDL